MALKQRYYMLWFVNFRLWSTSGHRVDVALRLRDNQELPGEVLRECTTRKKNPFELLTECSKKLFYDYPLGTEFLLKSKLTDREGGGLFFYSYFGWKPLEVVLGS